MTLVMDEEGGAMSLCRCESVSEDGKHLTFSISSGRDTETFSGDEMLEKLVKEGYPKYIIPGNKLYGSKLFESIRFADGKEQEDDRIIHHIYGACGKVILLDDIFYHYRINPVSVMHRKIEARRYDGVEAMLDRCEYMQTRGKTDLAARSLTDAVRVLAELHMRADKPDAAIKSREKKLTDDIRRLYRREYMHHLEKKEKIRLFLGVHAMRPCIAAQRLRYRLSKGH